MGNCATTLVNFLGGPIRSREFDFDDWSLFTMDYSAASFTDQSDRMIALSSIVKELQSQFGNRSHYAGLWEGELEHGLAWSCADAPLMSDQHLTTVPSWTWTSAINQVLFALRSYSKRYTFHATLGKIHIVPLQEDEPYGNVQEGTLEMMCQIIDLMLATSNTKDLDHTTTTDPGFHSISPTLRWNEAKDALVEARLCKVIPFLTYVDTQARHRQVLTRHSGIVVESVSPNQELYRADEPLVHFRRIGWFEYSHWHPRTDVLHKFALSDPEQGTRTVVIV